MRRPRQLQPQVQTPSLPAPVQQDPKLRTVAASSKTTAANFANHWSHATGSDAAENCVGDEQPVRAELLCSM